MYDHYFSNFGSPPVPDDICKDSAIRQAWFWIRRFFKVFPIQMHREANLMMSFRFNDASTHEGHLRQNGELT